MIRYARPADHAAIAAVVSAAFGKPDEARLIERLRADEDVMFELVAEADGEISGHVLFSRLWADRYDLYAALAPLAVRPDLQRAGLGSRLVRAGLDCAREFGAFGVIVLGHPAYYPRFGFSAAAAAQVRSPYAGDPAFMALALEDNAFDAPMRVAYPDAFSGET
ncbi:MAG: acetyltransferase, family [Phenylobacterium sp.]|nr:acetyltransferase, family [Phenylobacterium sp.]